MSSFGFLLVTVVLASVLVPDLSGPTVATPECNCDATSVGAREWRIWVATVAAGWSIAILLAIRGLVRLRRLPEQPPHETKNQSPVMRAHGWMARAWVLCLACTVPLLVHGPLEWPMSMMWRLSIVSTIGLLCPAPRVAITWLCHQAARVYRTMPHEMAAAQRQATASPQAASD